MMYEATNFELLGQAPFNSKIEHNYSINDNESRESE